MLIFIIVYSLIFHQAAKKTKEPAKTKEKEKPKVDEEMDEVDEVMANEPKQTDPFAVLTKRY